MTEELLSRLSPEALLLEPREFFDKALVDVTEHPKDHWPRKGGLTVAVYDREKCIGAIMASMQIGYEEALEWFGYNTEGAWLGEGTPTFRGMEPECEGDYLADVEECPDCGERFCAKCEKHWSECPCPGPSN
jgi:hypothetical protein